MTIQSFLDLIEEFRFGTSLFQHPFIKAGRNWEKIGVEKCGASDSKKFGHD